MGSVVAIFDRLANAITGAGTSRDPRMASSYVLRAPLTQQDITAAYRGSGLIRKIVAIPPLDMVREWREWKGLDADEATAVWDTEVRLMLRQKVRQVEVLRRLGGGALVLGLPGEPSQPAPPTVAKNGLAFVNVVSRWQLAFDALADDAREAGFGEPLMWRMASATGVQIEIHPSRVIPFRADNTAAMAMTMNLGNDADAFWGESVIAQVIDAVKDSDTVGGAFASLVSKARLTRIGIPGLSEIASTADGITRLQGRLSTIALAESIHNATIYDAGDGTAGSGEQITEATYSFAGAKDLINAARDYVAAIADIPATRLFGRAPEGMNSSGESQQKDWGKRIRAEQTLELGPCLDRIDAFMLPSALGRPAPDASYEFAPLDLPSEKERADRFKVQMEAAKILYDLAAMPERAANRGLQSLMIEEGYWPELEAALAELGEDERFGVEADMSAEPEPVAPPIDPNAKGGDPNETGAGGQPDQEPFRRAANDAALLAANPQPQQPISITVPVEIHMAKGAVTRTTVTKHTGDGRIAEFEQREVEE